MKKLVIYVGTIVLLGLSYGVGSSIMNKYTDIDTSANSTVIETSPTETTIETTEDGYEYWFDGQRETDIVAAQKGLDVMYPAVYMDPNTRFIYLTDLENEIVYEVQMPGFTLCTNEWDIMYYSLGENPTGDNGIYVDNYSEEAKEVMYRCNIACNSYETVGPFCTDKEYDDWYKTMSYEQWAWAGKYRR